MNALGKLIWSMTTKVRLFKWRGLLYLHRIPFNTIQSLCFVIFEDTLSYQNQIFARRALSSGISHSSSDDTSECRAKSQLGFQLWCHFTHYPCFLVAEFFHPLSGKLFISSIRHQFFKIIAIPALV